MRNLWICFALNPTTGSWNYKKTVPKIATIPNFKSHYWKLKQFSGKEVSFFRITLNPTTGSWNLLYVATRNFWQRCFKSHYWKLKPVGRWKGCPRQSGFKSHYWKLKLMKTSQLQIMCTPLNPTTGSWNLFQRLSYKQTVVTLNPTTGSWNYYKLF